MDLVHAGSAADADLETRSRLYQSITRAQLQAIVVNEFLEGGFLEHLTLCKLVKREFDESEGRIESSTAAATEVVKERVQESSNESMRGSAAGNLAKSSASLDGALQSGKRAVAPASEKVAEQKSMMLRESHVWDTSSNKIQATSSEPRYDPARRSPAEALEILRSMFTPEPLPPNCPYPKDECLLLRQRTERLSSKSETRWLFLRDGTCLRTRLSYVRDWEYDGRHDLDVPCEKWSASVMEGPFEMVGFILLFTCAQAEAHNIFQDWGGSELYYRTGNIEKGWRRLEDAHDQIALRVLIKSSSSSRTRNDSENDCLWHCRDKLSDLSGPFLQALGMNPLNLWFWQLT